MDYIAIRTFSYFSFHQSVFKSQLSTSMAQWETFSTTIVSCANLSDLARWLFKKNWVKTAKFGSCKAEIFKCPTLPVEHIRNFHCIKYFYGYLTSSTSTEIFVTHTHLTDWSLLTAVLNLLRTVKFISAKSWHIIILFELEKFASRA